MAELIEKTKTEYDHLSKEELIKVAIGLRDRSLKKQEELDILKNKLTLWERKILGGVSRDIENPAEETSWACIGCQIPIGSSETRETPIFKKYGRAYCADCSHAYLAEKNWNPKFNSNG